MWPVVIIFVLICGYNYIDNHQPSKIEFKKANGWHAYFQVALKGSEFFISGFLLALAFEFFLYLSMFILNVFFYIGIKDEPFVYASKFNEFRFATFSFFSWLAAFFITLTSVTQAVQAKISGENLEIKKSELRDICSKNPINHLLLESVESNLLVQITLKSRKVYIGIIESARFLDIDNYSESFISIIPFLSGYRDKDNLSFNPDCNYADIYSAKNIYFDSKPISLSQFRHVIQVTEIESFSLFDVDIYLMFNQAKKNESTNTKNPKNKNRKINSKKNNKN